MTNNNNLDGAPDMKLFWGCFIALITTAFAFITRAFMVNTSGAFWQADFGLNAVQAGELFGAGIWPFAISIILFSLIIDRVGYRAAMFFSAICYAIYAFMAMRAYGIVNAEGLEGDALKAAQASAYQYLYWGSVILGLGNGTVEAFINPVVATMFNKDKTKWLNILHAGWPGGLVLGGLLTIALGDAAVKDWRILIYLIAIPAAVYLVMLFNARFPVNERVSSGTSYKEMLAEFGYFGAILAAYLIFRQLGMVFGWEENFVYFLTLASAAAYGIYCNSLGRPILIFLCIIMMPLATTELGTDSAISGLMEEPLKDVKGAGLWVLIYTSAIMMILRFWFAGPIVQKLSPLGLLATSAVLAIAGLHLLSSASGLAMIFICATLYGFGKTFFWPTMLGVVSEQCPKGGALTLNAIAGIGMLAVGILGGPVIGKLTEDSIKDTIDAKDSAIYETISKDDKYFLGNYTAVDGEKVKALAEDKAKEVNELIDTGKQASLARITVFPMFMLACYLGMIFYFKGRGGYKPVELGNDSKDKGNDGKAHVSEA